MRFEAFVHPSSYSIVRNASISTSQLSACSQFRDREAHDAVGWRWYNNHALKRRLALPSQKYEWRAPTEKIFRSHPTIEAVTAPPVRTSDAPPQRQTKRKERPRIVVIAGFETFNVKLYKDAANIAKQRTDGQIDLEIFSDRDINDRPNELEEALQGADVFFASLIFDFEQVTWLQKRISEIPVRLVFESALELMSCTKIGAFSLGGGQPKGMPKPVKFILEKFGNAREEDRLAGYLSFLKVGPKLLKFIPVKKVQDLRQWLTIYSYWNAGGADNVSSMFCLLAQSLLDIQVGEIPAVVEAPLIGCVHPEYNGYFTSPKAYIDWFRQKKPQSATWPVVGMLLYRKHVITKLPYIPKLISLFEEAKLIPVPIFINGVEGHVAVRDLMTTSYEQEQRAAGIKISPALSPDAVLVDTIVSTIGFPLVGGPAGSMEAGRQVEVAKRILMSKNVPYIVAAPLLIQDIKSWTRQGIGGLQSVVLYSLPELDGAIDTIPLGGLVGDQILLVPERVRRLTGRIQKWVALHKKPAAQRKVAIILYGFPPGYGAAGTAALLNVPRSLVRLIMALKDAGYAVDDLPDGADPEDLITRVKEADESVPLFDRRGGVRTSRDPGDKEYENATVQAQKLERWLGYVLTKRVRKAWKDLTASPIKTFGDTYTLGGVQVGPNIWIGLQPPLGVNGDPMRLMFEKDLTPHPQYAAFYLWLQKEFKADALIHFGMHGTFEWLPGNPLGNTGYSWPDVMVGDLPNLYIYAANNPSESVLAKRRGLGTLISHNVPPYGRAGLYKQLVEIRNLIAEYKEDPVSNAVLWPSIQLIIKDAGLEKDCPIPDAVVDEQRRLGKVSAEMLRPYLAEVYEYLQMLENRLFSSGLHVLGQKPDTEQLRGYLDAYFGEGLPAQAIEAVLEGCDAKQVLARVPWSIDAAAVNEAINIRSLLEQTTDEITNLLRGLNGEYVPPAPGGDLLRDGSGVLPTGRNIHSLDPYRMPSPGAYERGKLIAEQLLTKHRNENGGRFPETVAVLLWGLDAIKTKGESVGILLGLVGAYPLKEATGRIVRYELEPLETLGRPRVDVLANLSGIFRDTFSNIIDLIDDLMIRASTADEPEEMNFIKKHVEELRRQGVENPTARLFSNPAGDFGSLVNDQVVSSTWEKESELGSTWKGRNAFSYGRKDRGVARTDVLDSLLKTTDTVIQEIDSVEYGLSDIQEYYANTGGLVRAAEDVRKGKKVAARVVESFSSDSTPRDIDEVLRIEYRTRLLNPRWAEAMANQGSGGAYEISQRFTAMIGWAGTTGFKDGWVYDQAASTYALDEDMAAKLKKSNPEAFRNVVGRLLEANGRGIWEAKPDVLGKLQQLYDDADDILERVKTD